jgi:hypothetical protein
MRPGKSGGEQGHGSLRDVRLQSELSALNVVAKEFTLQKRPRSHTKDEAFSMGVLAGRGHRSFATRFYHF